jgi:hypothetical protein
MKNEYLIRYFYKKYPKSLEIHTEDLIVISSVNIQDAIKKAKNYFKEKRGTDLIDPFMQVISVKKKSETFS